MREGENFDNDFKMFVHAIAGRRIKHVNVYNPTLSKTPYFFVQY